MSPLPEMMPETANGGEARTTRTAGRSGRGSLLHRLLRPQHGHEPQIPAPLPEASSFGFHPSYPNHQIARLNFAQSALLFTQPTIEAAGTYRATTDSLNVVHFPSQSNCPAINHCRHTVCRHASTEIGQRQLGSQTTNHNPGKCRWNKVGSYNW